MLHPLSLKLYILKPFIFNLLYNNMPTTCEQHANNMLATCSQTASGRCFADCYVCGQTPGCFAANCSPSVPSHMSRLVAFLCFIFFIFFKVALFQQCFCIAHGIVRFF